MLLNHNIYDLIFFSACIFHFLFMRYIYWLILWRFKKFNILIPLMTLAVKWSIGHGDRQAPTPEDKVD